MVTSKQRHRNRKGRNHVGEEKKTDFEDKQMQGQRPVAEARGHQCVPDPERAFKAT